MSQNLPEFIWFNGKLVPWAACFGAPWRGPRC